MVNYAEHLADDLADLRWHWPCYRHSHPQPDVWVAQRKDTRKTLRAETPHDLLLLIREDYARKPVPRGF